MAAVFVYGTLRRGGRNHRLLAGSRRLGSCRLGPGFTMLDLGACPGVIEAGRGSVTGEVYRVAARLWPRLDALEDYPEVYTRRVVRTPLGPAWVYLFRGERSRGRRVVPGGDWFRC
ncbi:MAG TPA: gamma-glutamylcyclotransferase family protein [Gammaproteobacteria bacterium]|nr:gamma-glutamylcyclotransferase family protein [Gammaproteobacteria bacterium]